MKLYKAAHPVYITQYYMAVFRMIADDQGFQTVSVPFAELYTALQIGVADGWSGGAAMVNYL